MRSVRVVDQKYREIKVLCVCVRACVVMLEINGFAFMALLIGHVKGEMRLQLISRVRSVNVLGLFCQ